MTFWKATIAAKQSRPTALCAAVVSLVAASPALASDELVLIPHVPTLITLLLLFVALIFPLNALIFRPVFRVLDEREARIKGARERAERLAETANAVIARYREAIRDVRAEAGRDRRLQLDAARTDHQQVTAAARAEAEQEIEASRAELARKVEEARTELRASGQSIARDMASRVLGRAL